jgi:hypothetical protein
MLESRRVDNDPLNEQLYIMGSGANLRLVYVDSEAVIPAKGGMATRKNRYPRIKYGAGRYFERIVKGGLR